LIIKSIRSNIKNDSIKNITERVLTTRVNRELNSKNALLLYK